MDLDIERCDLTSHGDFTIWAVMEGYVLVKIEWIYVYMYMCALHVCVHGCIIYGNYNIYIYTYI
jgi:hypothetical protein